MEIGAIVVENESVESVEIDNVAGQVGSGAVNKTGRWDVSIEKISSDLNVLEFTAVSDVTDQDSVDLSDSCNRNSNSDTGFVDFLVDDLDFEGRIAAEDFSRRDFESLDEGHGIDGALEIGSEGEQDMNVLA